MLRHANHSDGSSAGCAALRRSAPQKRSSGARLGFGHAAFLPRAFGPAGRSPVRGVRAKLGSTMSPASQMSIRSTTTSPPYPDEPVSCCGVRRRRRSVRRFLGSGRATFVPKSEAKLLRHFSDTSQTLLSPTRTSRCCTRALDDGSTCCGNGRSGDEEQPRLAKLVCHDELCGLPTGPLSATGP